MKPYCLKESRAVPGDERKKNERLAVEARISLRLGRSPNLVTTYAAAFYRSRLFILTEYLSGMSLDLRLKTEPPSLKSALKFGVQLAAALRVAQTRLPGFVHGDIKPGNCFIAADGTLKLGDFGLASADGLGGLSVGASLGNRHDSPSSDTSVGWGGTVAYMAPEMFGKTEPDRSSVDIYAYGVTLFEMLCGTRPFPFASKEGIIEMHRNSEPPIHLLQAKDVPKPVVDIVKKCLAKSPEERNVSFECVEDTLCKMLRDQFDSVVPIEPIPESNHSEIVRRAISFAVLGHTQDATEGLSTAIGHLAGSPEILASKAIALTLGSRTNDAYEASTSALMTHADSFVVFLAHSQVLIARGDLDIAEEYLLRALRLQPNNCVALNLMGTVCLQTMQYRAARRYFDRSRILDASQTEPLEGIAIASLAEGRTGTAINLIQKAIAIDPLQSGLHGLLGDAYRANDQTIEAIVSYKAGLRLVPLSKGIDRRLVRSCIEFYMGKGHSVDVQMARTLIFGARIFTKERDVSCDDFALSFISLFQESHFDPLLLFFFDNSLAEVADRISFRTSQKLSGLLRIAFERCSSPAVPIYVIESLGRIFYYLGEYKECQAVFNMILDRFGSHEHSFYYLAACSEIEEDFQTSLKYYLKALDLEDCEDSRTGMRRVMARIQQMRKNTGSLSN
ncbi:MAG: protein kinase [Pyrinomonadaceae bacterium]